MRIWSGIIGIILAAALVLTGPAIATLSVNVNPDSLLSISLSHVHVGAQAGDEVVTQGEGLQVGDEVVDLRGEYSKTYYQGGRTYQFVTGGGITHYKDDPEDSEELWKDVDTTIVESDRENWDWEVTTGKYHILIRADTAIAFGIDGHWVGFRYDGFGYLDWASKNHEILGTRQPVTPVVSANKITWTGIFGAGTSLEYVYTDHRLQTNLYIEQSARNWLGNNPPSKFGLSNQTSYLVGFAEMDWQNAHPAEDADGNTINWSNINEFIDSGVYWRHPLKDVIVNAMPIEYAKHDDLEPDEWVKLRYRFYKHEDKHYLLFGAHVLDLNAYPEGTINLDPTLTVQPSSKDNSLSQQYPTTSYSSYAFVLCRSGSGVNTRPIIEFDISALPSGVTIGDCMLALYAYQFSSSAGRTYWAYKLTRTDWVESQSTWNIYKTGSDWTTAGGDYVISSPSGGSDTVPSSAAWMEWDVKAIVVDAYSQDNPAEFLLRDGTENDAGYTYHRSKDYTTEADRPKLVIDYTEAVTTKRGAFFMVM